MTGLFSFRRQRRREIELPILGAFRIFSVTVTKLRAEMAVFC